MSERMDFLDFQRRMQEEYGITDTDMERLKKVHVLTFFTTEGATGWPSCPGGVVFRHKDGGQHIDAGETWVCEVLEKGTTFFAIGVLRIDAVLLRPSVGPGRCSRGHHLEGEPEHAGASFREMYRNKLEETLNARLLESKKREEEALAKIEELKAEIDANNTRHKMVISVGEGADGTEESVRLTPSEDNAPAPAFPFSMELNPRIRRVSADELYSEDFRHRNYFVHLSGDHSILTIRPHDRGNVVCIDNRITLCGLSLVSPYGGPADMPAEYNPKYGGYVVYLKYIPSTSYE